MELQEILSISIGTLVVVVIAHFAVFWVVRTLYPPIAPIPAPIPVAPVVTAPAFIEPAVIEQHVTLPTYEKSGAVEATREERRGPPPPEDTSIKRATGVAAADA